jgi:hypothetical protein
MSSSLINSSLLNNFHNKSFNITNSNFYNSPLLLRINGRTKSDILNYTDYIRISGYHIRFTNSVSKNPSKNSFICKSAIDEITVIMDQIDPICAVLAEDINKGTFFDNDIDIIETSNVNGNIVKIIQHCINGQITRVVQHCGNPYVSVMLKISPSAVASTMFIYQEGNSTGSVEAFVDMNTEESGKSLVTSIN